MTLKARRLSISIAIGVASLALTFGATASTALATEDHHTGGGPAESEVPPSGSPSTEAPPTSGPPGTDPGTPPTTNSGTSGNVGNPSTDTPPPPKDTPPPTKDDPSTDASGGGDMPPHTAHPNAVTPVSGGGGTAVAGANSNPAAGGGAAPTGALPYTGVGDLLWVAGFGLVALLFGAWMYRDAGRRERHARAVAMRFQWRPVQEMCQWASPVPLDLPDYSDKRRFAWVDSRG